MSAAGLVLAPLVPWPVLGAVAALAGLALALAAWRGLPGWPWRALGALVLVAVLAGPSLRREERAPLPDFLLAVVDESASQRIGDRPEQTEAALAGIRAQARARGLELRVERVGDAPEDGGTRIVGAIERALAGLPGGQLAGVIVISDGQAHDGDQPLPGLGVPVHLLATGHAADWDRRLVIDEVPAFAIVGEPQVVRLHVEDMGAVPEAGPVALSVSVGGAAPVTRMVRPGAALELPFTLERAGPAVIRLALAEAPGELTAKNNAAILAVNGVRDRLRVLLVSGQPHPGTRTWRNLLKSDASVDLVHFTILRSPDKRDGVPVSELSLIAFPTQELFLDKIDEFDLIIFDRYKLRGILPRLYLENVRRYVEEGGAVLVAAGPDLASVDSLARSPLGEVLPGAPTGRVIEQAFTPALTEEGRRHPVTRGLEALAPEGGWGPWLRQVEVTARAGHTLMAGAEGAPLLVLDRAGEGRVALLASDQAWLWARGYEGGGPQLELLRRLAHWLMREPELEEERLTAEAEGETLLVRRASMAEGGAPRVADVTLPDGTARQVALAPVGPGQWEGRVPLGGLGFYRLAEGWLETVVAVGPSAPREFEATLADPGPLAGLRAATGGGVARIEAGLPALRPVAGPLRPGRVAAGRGWLGYTPRGAYVTSDIRLSPLAPAWLALLLVAGLALGAWLREGRRG